MKDESARHKAIENLVSDKLRARTTSGNGCPEAEIIAAYFERSLAPKERIRWEAHFDTCAECQHRIAALVRMDEAGEASISKPVAKFAPEPRKSSILSTGGRNFGRWAWAAPMLLVVLVAGLWYTGEFDSIVNRHPETAERAAAPSAHPPKMATSENRVAGLQGGKAQASQASPAATAKDESKTPQKVAATAGEVGQVAKAQASLPPPPPLKTDLSSERREKETASAAPSAEGAQAQSQPVTGQNADVLSADEQKQGTGAGQGQGVGSATGALSGGLAGAVSKTQPEAPTAAAAAGEVQAKAENAPAPSPPPAATTAEVEPRQSPGAFNTTTESSARLFKKAAAPSLTLAGTVKGIVRDPSGAAIPGATVQVTNTRSNTAKWFTTNDAGEYVAGNLIPGDYTVEASARGFEASSRKNVPLPARADRQVDFSLQVGSATATVAVEAAGLAPQTSAPLWRVGPHGLIEKRSGQDGWETKPSGVAVDLYAISFATHEVGWVVGQVGTVLRSANGGESWGRVASPTGEDLIRVRATSAESSEVTTRSGIVFKTTDGAATWTRIETAQ